MDLATFDIIKYYILDRLHTRLFAPIQMRIQHTRVWIATDIMQKVAVCKGSQKSVRTAFETIPVRFQ